MNREKANFLKAEMRKVTDVFNFKFLSTCGKCDNKQEIDYFDYFARVFIVCPQCGAETTFKEAVGISIFGEIPFYKQKFIDGHFKVIQQLTIRDIDFSQDITEEQEAFFDDNWDFAGGFLDIYTSFEMLLYQLTFRRVEELINTGKKLDLDIGEQQKCSKAVVDLIERVNSGDKIGTDLIIEGIEQDFSVKDCVNFLKKSSMKIRDIKSCYYKLREKRNNIVHRGRQANFEDYAKAFISVGRILHMYAKK